MADNYLENKMEQLRSGKLNADIRRAAVKPRKGMWQIAFPSRRVLLAISDSAITDSLIREYLKLDCKVAILENDKTRGERLAHDCGIRLYNIAPHSQKDEIAKAFENLMHAWKDVDIIICDSALSYIIMNLWKEHKTRFPFPSSYGGRLIIIDNSTSPLQNSNPATENIIPSSENPNSVTENITPPSQNSNSLTVNITPLKIYEISNAMSPYNISANAIIINPSSSFSISPSPDSASSTAPYPNLYPSFFSFHPSSCLNSVINSICLFLSLPNNSIIRGLSFPL